MTRPEPMSDRIKVRIPDELRQAIARIAERQHRTMSSVAREAIDRYVTAAELERLRNAPRPRDPQRG